MCTREHTLTDIILNAFGIAIKDCSKYQLFEKCEVFDRFPYHLVDIGEQFQIGVFWFAPLIFMHMGGSGPSAPPIYTDSEQ